LVRKGQRTGIFDLKDVDSIQLNSQLNTKLNPIKQQKEETLVIGTPQILVEPTQIKRNGKIPISNALLIIQEQLKITGIRKVTAYEFIHTIKRFTNDMELEFVEDITLEVLLEWLSKLGDISNVTKNSRLRVIKAVLNRMYDNGWFEKNWWKPLKIKTDEKIKPPADEQQLAILLSLLDMSNFIQFRDAVAILTMYHCGLRVATLIRLEEKHIDFETNTLLLTGDIMKNHEILKLTIPDELAVYFKRLIQQNNVIRKYFLNYKKGIL